MARVNRLNTVVNACEVCGKSFLSHPSARRLTCSPDCKKLRENHLQALQRRSRPPRLHRDVRPATPQASVVSLASVQRALPACPAPLATALVDAVDHHPDLLGALLEPSPLVGRVLRS